MRIPVYESDRIWKNVRIATFDPRRACPYGMLEGHLLGVRDGRISAILPEELCDLGSFGGEVIEGAGRLLTPALIDCHTHLVYGGHRAGDFEKRLCGVSYEEIARAGGGILSTVAVTRSLTEDALVEVALPRLSALVQEGVGTLEVKSGYGLTLGDEFKMLRAARRLEGLMPVRIRTTLLAAHAVPPEYRSDPDAYVDLVCAEMIPRAATEGLADAVDVFCESIAFSLAQAERIFTAARAAGLGIRVHAEQLSDSGAAALAAGFGAWSADHLECLDEKGAGTLGASGTVAVLLPGAFYFLRESRKPPVERLRRNKVPMAVATDLNPGSSPFASLRLMMNMACTLFGLTPEEALTGVTRNAAAALGMKETLGILAVGRMADMLLWEMDHPAQLVCELGWGKPLQRIIGGQIVQA